MAGERIKIGGTVVFIDYPDGYGETILDGVTIRWEFHEYCGPGFFKIHPYKDDDGTEHEHEEYFCPDEDSVLWPIFDAWLANYRLTHPHPSTLSLKAAIRSAKIKLG